MKFQVNKCHTTKLWRIIFICSAVLICLSVSSVVKGSDYYSVQIAALREPERATPIINSMKEKGYNPFLLKATIRGKGEWYRVCVGMYNSTKAALIAGDKLKKRGVIDEYVLRRFNPDEILTEPQFESVKTNEVSKKTEVDQKPEPSVKEVTKPDLKPSEIQQPPAPVQSPKQPENTETQPVMLPNLSSSQQVAKENPENLPKNNNEKVKSEEVTQKTSSLSISLKSRLDKWTVSKKKYTHLRNGGYFNPDTIVERDSDIGFLFGPEITYAYKKFFIRGTYLQGENDFANGRKGTRKNVGIDVGYGQTIGGFIGYRSMDASFSNWQTANIADHSISDVVLGLFLRTDPDKPGFSANFEMLAGIQGIVNAFSDDGFKENTFIGEAELNFGYRFTTLPLTLSVGYGIWVYDTPARKYAPDSTLISDKVLERWEHWGHGATLKGMYSF